MEAPTFITQYYISPEPNHKRRVFVVAENTGDKSCRCRREVENITCKSCGHSFTGRRRLQCNVHPNVIHLMDICNCPNCNRDL